MICSDLNRLRSIQISHATGTSVFKSGKIYVKFKEIKWKFWQFILSQILCTKFIFLNAYLRHNWYLQIESLLYCHFIESYKKICMKLSMWLYYLWSTYEKCSLVHETRNPGNITSKSKDRQNSVLPTWLNFEKFRKEGDLVI